LTDFPFVGKTRQSARRLPPMNEGWGGSWWGRNKRGARSTDEGLVKEKRGIGVSLRIESSRGGQALRGSWWQSLTEEAEKKKE